MALAVHLATNCLPHLHQGPGEIERENDVADVIEIRTVEPRGERVGTYADTNPTANNAKYNGLNRIAIASFQPKTTNTPYIQYGICAIPDTVLLFAST